MQRRGMWALKRKIGREKVGKEGREKREGRKRKEERKEKRKKKRKKKVYKKKTLGTCLTLYDKKSLLDLIPNNSGNTYT
jgi:hypothetical protein